MTHRIQALFLAAALLAALSGCKPQAQPAEPQQEELPTEAAQTAETPSAAPQEPDAAEPPPESSDGEAQPSEPSAPAQTTPYEGLVLDENEVFFPLG